VGSDVSIGFAAGIRIQRQPGRYGPVLWLQGMRMSWRLVSRPERCRGMGGGQVLPLPGEERLQPEQVRRVPGREHRQRAEQAHPRTGRARFAFRAVQAGQRVGAGGDEHVPLPADQLGDRGLVELRAADQLGEASGTLRGLRRGEDRGGVGLAQQVGPGVGDDRVDVVPLGRRAGRQVVVAFHRGAVVGVDGRPVAAEPGSAVAVGLERGADPVPVDRQQLPVVGEHAARRSLGGAVGAPPERGQPRPGQLRHPTRMTALCEG
jgi:hypothetical protein